MSDIVKIVSRNVRQLGEKIENAIYKMSATFIDSDKSITGCLQCRGNVPGGSGRFCSQRCVLKYWERFRDHYNTNISKDESKVCRLPGCDNLCFVENDGKVHDFCRRGHAEEYKKLNDEIEVGGYRATSPSKYSAGLVTGHSGATVGSYSSTGGSSSSWRKPPSTGPILFYNREDPYYEFTNFYYSPITLDGKRWTTSEHYFQAQKFVGTSHVEVIRNLTRPREAFEYARNPSVSRWQRGDWESVKMDVMRKALLAKFSQHDDLRRKLVETGDRQLIEHSPYDSFWGDGGDGKGQNHLGKLLMEIRTILISGSHS